MTGPGRDRRVHKHHWANRPKRDVSELDLDAETLFIRNWLSQVGIVFGVGLDCVLRKLTIKSMTV